MPTSKLLKYSLRDINGKYYYVDITNAVQLSTTPKYLVYSPTDWEKTEVAMGRDGKDWGVFRNVILPITFCKDGARILRKIAFESSVDSYCKYEIHRRNDNDNNYTLLTYGDIDFSQLINQNETISIKAVENGLVQKLSDKEETIYEFDLSTLSEARDVVLDGVKLQAEYKWVVPETLDIDGIPTQYTGIGTGLVDAASYSNDGFIEVVEVDNQYHDGGVTYPRLFVNKIGYSGVVSGNFTFYQFNNSGVNNLVTTLKIAFFDSTHSLVGMPVTLFTFPTVTPSTSNTTDCSFSYAITGVPNHYIQLQLTHSLSVLPDYQIVGDGNIKLKASFQVPSTKAKAIRLKDLYKKLIAKIDPTADTDSNYLFNPTKKDFNCRPFDIWVTSGSTIRGVNTILKTSLKDFKKSMLACFGLTMGVDKTLVRFDKLSWLLKDDKILFDAGKAINKYRVTVANEHRVGLINVGYPDQQYDEINGLQEFCSEQQWSTGLVNNKNTLALQSVYRADPYGIEYCRTRALVNNMTSTSSRFKTTTTDDSADNDVFMIQCDDYSGTGDVSILRFGGVTGFLVANSTIFNTMLSPKSNLLRNMEYIKSGLCYTKTIKLQSGKKNTGGKYTVESIVDEDASISTSTYPKYFNPFYYEIDCEIPTDLIGKMNTIPTKFGKVRFKDDRGNVLSGFPIDIKSNPSMKTAHTVKLLCSPTDDLTLQSFIS